jgi:predicted Zn finger-like uncharacterized protein
MIVSCDCGAKLKIDETKITGRKVKVRCPRCGNVLPLQQTRPAAPATPPEKSPPTSASAEPLVLIAHDSNVVSQMVSTVLSDDGFRVVTASDGVEALRKAAELRPQGMVLDVGLPGIYGFELCERLKGDPDTKAIKIVLLSSVYDMRRYKRTPVSLYGADDYIEKHHIPDFLGLKLRRLIYPEAFAGTAPKGAALPHDELPERSRPPAREFESSLLSQEPQPPAGKDIGDPVPRPAAGAPKQHADSYEAAPILPVSISLDSSIFQKEECDIPPVREEDPEAVEKARRFARIIVSDVALYNQETVIEGIRNGKFFELLRTDVEEGRELFEKRVPASIRAKKDYYQEAFDNFITAARKRIMH